jgi:N-methylhydantoinase A
LVQSSGSRSIVAAVDIGGTFTDAVMVSEDGRVGYGKALSSSGDDFQTGFFGSLKAAAEQLGDDEDVFDRLRLISHGSTVATNIVVQQRGATVGLLTTGGHEDTLGMMRGTGRRTGEAAEDVLKLTDTFKPEPLVPRGRIVGCVERIDSVGRVLVALDEERLRADLLGLVRDGCDAFAIAFLWSIQNPAHELRAREIVNEIAPDAFVSVSHELSKTVGEYERTVAAVINAFVGTKTSQYLTRLDEQLQKRGFADGLMLMQSHGGMVPLSHGRETPIMTVGSGPVGGLIGTQRLGEQLGMANVIATDMGGTSFDVGIVSEGEPVFTRSTTLGKWQFNIPAVEVLSIGAGGGSIAWIDPHSTGLRVGPQSASSSPGPACYGLGGEEPTVTDANVLLGYVDPEAVFGTSATASFALNPDLAERAVQRVAAPLGLSTLDAALGIVEIVNAKMANVLERMVVGRGFDPRDFILAAYGGGGPLHAAGYARELGIQRIVVPGEVASVWSAFGISLSDVRYQAERDVVLVSPFDPATIEAAFIGLEEELMERAASTLQRLDAEPRLRRLGHMRYEWQRNELDVGFAGGRLDEAAIDAATSAFERRYEARYGSAALLPEAHYELTTLSVELTVPVAARDATRQTRSASGSPIKPARPVAFQRGEPPVDTPIYDGNAVTAGETIHGPAVIDLPTTGIVVPPYAQLERSDAGDFILTIEENAR